MIEREDRNIYKHLKVTKQDRHYSLTLDGTEVKGVKSAVLVMNAEELPVLTVSVYVESADVETG